MAYLASRPWLGGLAFTACAVLVSGASALASGCDETTGLADGPEDKDGINEVPSPSKSDSVGSASGGGSGEGGTGGGVNGKPCLVQSQCDDDDVCTDEDCVDEVCVQTERKEDNDACTVDTCTPNPEDPENPTVTHMPAVIDDMNACTFDSCDTVEGVSNLLAISLFEEDFLDNDAGWTLGPQWEIGAAAPSSGAYRDGNDPGMDVSETGDGVAGTDLGGLVVGTNGPSYLLSPAIDVSSVAEGEFVTLRFQRWLNTRGPNEMSATVEAGCEGQAFSTLWPSVGNSGEVNDAPSAGEGSPATGTGWFAIRLNLSPKVEECMAASLPLRIRFGLNVMNAGNPSSGGWNIDDVQVGRTVIEADPLICTFDTCMSTKNGPSPMHMPVAGRGGCLEVTGPSQAASP